MKPIIHMIIAPANERIWFARKPNNRQDHGGKVTIRDESNMFYINGEKSVFLLLVLRAMQRS